jgi:hypothetical protein
MDAWRYEFIFLCSSSISHSFAADSLVIYQAWTLEDKFQISARPCIISYLLFHFENGKILNITLFFYLLFLILNDKAL